MKGIGFAPLRQTPSDSDIMTRALTIAGAKRDSSEEFGALNEPGESVDVHRGRDFAVWALPRRPACA